MLATTIDRPIVDQIEICELCGRYGGVPRNLSEDIEMETVLGTFLEQTSGEQQAVSDIHLICDECYNKFADNNY